MCRLGSPIDEPQTIAVLSSRDPSPSIVFFIFSRKYPIRLSLCVLMRLKSMMSAGTLPWCEAPWIDLLVPLSGKVRFDWSKPILVRYSSIARRSTAPRSLFRRATSAAIQSMTLRSVRRRAARSAAESPAPKSCSKTARGSRMAGSGWVGDAHATEVV